jgi:hypothetical protein
MASFSEHMDDILERLPKWVAYPILVILWVGVPLLVSWILSAFFWSAPWLFVALLFLVPAASWWLSHKFERSPLPVNQAKVFRKATLAVYLVVAITVALNFSSIRDLLGEQLIPGYRVEYYEGEDSYGNPTEEASISTDHWFYTVLAYASAPIVYIALLLLFGFVYNTTARIVQHSQDYETRSQERSEQPPLSLLDDYEN